jgi:hypothetical protein
VVDYMGKMICGWDEERLLEYGTGGLDSDTRASLKRHFADCGACRAFVAGQHSVWAALDAWEAPPVSAGFDRALHRRMADAAGWGDRLARWFRPAWVRRGLPLMAAAGALVVAAVVWQRPAAAPISRSAGRGAASVKPVQIDQLRPDQVEGALQEMETLQEFDGMIRPDSGNSEM